MSHEVDLRQLAIERDEAPTPGIAGRRHLFARYVLPGCLIVAFLLMLAWALRDVVLPATRVTVVPIHVSRAAVQQAGTPLFKAAGWVEPRPTPIAVAALAPGVVEQLLVVEDQAVEAGDAVAVLVADDARLAHQRAVSDRRLRQAELDEAQATLDAAQIRFDEPVHLEAALAEAEARLAAAHTRLADVPFQLQTAQARHRFTEADYEGKKRSGSAVAAVELEESLSAFTAAQALVQQLRRQETSLNAEVEALTRRRDALNQQLDLRTEERRQLNESRAQVAAAAARLEQAKVAEEEAQLRLDRMTVRAPVAGHVFRLWSHPGARLVPGMGPVDGRDGSTVVSMYRPDSLQVRVDVRFDDLPQVRPDQPVIIESPAVPGPLEGDVLFLSSLADIQKNTLEVKVSIDQPPEVFKPEMLVDVTFLAPDVPDGPTPPEQQDLLFVPKQLVQQGDAGPYVWVADQAAGVARRTPIATGRRGTSELIEVTRGLNVSSRLIAQPAAGLSDGQRIRVTGEDRRIGEEEE
jgi:RND family efflux transporter MFP subunit